MKTYHQFLLFMWMSISSAFANECRTNKDCGPTKTCQIRSYEVYETDPLGEDIRSTEVELRCMSVPIYCEGDYTCEAPHLTCIEERGPYGRPARRPNENDIDSNTEEWILP